MQRPSRMVDSPQSGPHRRLLERVAKHRLSDWRQPVADHTRHAFSEVASVIATDPRPLILDSGCGTGESTAHIAAGHPTSWVIGLDQSERRLARSGWRWPLSVTDNRILVRAEAADFWRLALADGWALAAHYLLYPNPWPKPSQLGRRWHGHPVFPALLRLGGQLELRSNWRTYVEEFAQAVQFLTGVAPDVRPVAVETPISPFEKKYAASHHRLYSMRVDLSELGNFDP